ncbi:MAG: TIGR04348 family glycosyltransferase [Actinomycetota bacterium]|nr:TIGR04348 family glycosyltransferase [Actinomycetota bacterium]
MRVCLVTPAPPRSRKGNRVTAERWAAILRELGHDPSIVEAYEDQRCDVLVALHARRSAPSVGRFRDRRPRAPLVLALTGTDLYRDLAVCPAARRALTLADRLVVLQPLGVDELPQPLRHRARVIYQSAQPPPVRQPPAGGVFEVAVLAHLRPVKDPLLAARAVRLLPPESTLTVLHLGAALEADLAHQARSETATNRRYRWLGDLPHARALRLLARCRLLVVSSKLEGGANVVTEAIACSVPVLSTRVAGSVGILGADYPGYFPVGDADRLGFLLDRAEHDRDGLYKDLRRRCDALKPLVDPARERRSWQQLLAELEA